ncbi:hypothetical protein PCC6912_41560 [Chlorogloeopsis fritschii PCC 6912]|uniref:Uncharacterized protein n=1 Tax=Chlorogloeopsis fritschii PCC 6912 TaxID=211165 RepID=A0A433N5Q7_CHLFR|nr:hypothetical protein PCC6912_41560 [Chlorogloeopsis fritschii PCC 6912]
MHKIFDMMIALEVGNRFGKTQTTLSEGTVIKAARIIGYKPLTDSKIASK